MMQVCRLVWSHASRPGYSKVIGIKVNPFKGMGIKASSEPGKGNRDASRAEYDLYHETARAVSGHSKLDTTAIYNKANQAKARRIARARRAHIALITAGEKGESTP